MLSLPAARALVAPLLLSLAAALTVVPFSTATATATAAAAAGDADPAPEPIELRVGTFNIRSGVSLSGFLSAADAFKPQVDVAGLQEIGANAKNKRLIADRDWGYYRPPALQQNPVIWRRDLFDFDSARGFLLAKAMNIGNEHGGGKDAKRASWATIVRLVHRDSGQRISVINLHLVHGAVKAGRPWPGRPKLYKLYRTQVNGAVRAVRSERRRADRSDRIFLLGDFNVGYEADAKRRLKALPLRKFRRAGLTSMWQGSPDLDLPYGTHNDALIDQVFAEGRPQSTRIANEITESDHFPALASYLLPVKDGWAPTTGTVGFKELTASTEEKWDNGKPRMVFELTGDLSHGYVRLRIAGGTATEGNDYELDDHELHDNDFSRNRVVITVQPNDGAEPDETIELELVDPVNTVIDPDRARAVGTILANRR